MDADQERREICAAMDRLLTGRPLHTQGALTIVGLAQEANVKRHVLTHRHTDLKDEFNAQVRAQHHVPPQLAAAHDRNDLLQRRLDAALEDNRRLSDQVHALRASSIWPFRKPRSIRAAPFDIWVRIDLIVILIRSQSGSNSGVVA